MGYGNLALSALDVGMTAKEAITLKFKNDSKLLISRNLYSNINDFALILRNEIHPEILDRLKKNPDLRSLFDPSKIISEDDDAVLSEACSVETAF
jgi:hypothetical protein